MKTHQKERNAKAVKMREAGLTYQEIADALSMTRQRAFQIVKRDYSHPPLQAIDRKAHKE